MGDVLCIPRWRVERTLFEGGPCRSGFLQPARSHEALATLCVDALWCPRDRTLELDPSWKQAIPYIVVRRPGSDVLTYVRCGKTSGEARLHNARSIGVGGHVEREDEFAAPGRLPSPTLTIRRAAYRELAEELGWPGERPYLEFMGFLNDEHTPVGRVHLGVCFIAMCFSREAEFRPGDGIADLRFADYKSLVHGECEPWTQYVISSGVLD